MPEHRPQTALEIALSAFYQLPCDLLLFFGEHLDRFPRLHPLAAAFIRVGSWRL